MANEAQALAGEPQNAGDSVYEALEAVLASCERGRAFLAEHARRSRQADTDMLLKALARMETMLAEQRVELREPAPVVPARAPPAATALAAVVAQAVAAAESDLPEVTVIKAGNGPPPARFAGEDFATVDEGPTGADAATAADLSHAPAAPRPIAEFAADSNAVADGEPPDHAATADAPVNDALAAILALSDEERLALFS